MPSARCLRGRAANGSIFDALAKGIRMVGRSAAWISILLVILSPLAPLAWAQQEQAEDNRAPAMRGSPRDVAAGEKALADWWGEASKTRDERLAWWRDA